MLKDFYDDKTEPIVKIEEFYGEQKHIVNKWSGFYENDFVSNIFQNYARRRMSNAYIGQTQDGFISIMSNYIKTRQSKKRCFF